MLDAIRKRQNNFIFSILILMVIAVMAMYGIGQFGQSKADRKTTIARVNGEQLTIWDLQMEMAELFGPNIDDNILNNPFIIENIVQLQIRNRVLAQQATRLNFRVPDNELAEHIRTLPYYQRKGKFNAELYAQLPNRGVEEKWRRQRLQATKLQNYLTDRTRLTPLEVRQAFFLKHTRVELEYAKVDFEVLSAKIKASEPDVVNFVEVTPEAELSQYYESHRGDFTDKAQVDLRKIRVSVPFQGTEAQKSQAKKKIEEISSSITPENFSEIAKKSSDDEFASKGGATGWITRGSLQKPLEEAIDKLDIDKVSAPIETPFGYFIIQVKGKKPEVVRPYSEVKRSVAEKLYLQKAKSTFIEEKRKAWEKLLSENKSIESELKMLKIEFKKAGPFALGDETIPGIGKAEGISEGIFELTPESPVGKKLYYHEKFYYFIKLTKVLPSKEADYPKEKASVEEDHKRELRTAVLTSWTEELLKRAKIKREMGGPSDSQPAEEP